MLLCLPGTPGLREFDCVNAAPLRVRRKRNSHCTLVPWREGAVVAVGTGCRRYRHRLARLEPMLDAFSIAQSSVLAVRIEQHYTLSLHDALPIYRKSVV